MTANILDTILSPLLDSSDSMTISRSVDRITLSQGAMGAVQDTCLLKRRLLLGTIWSDRLKTTEVPHSSALIEDKSN